MTIKGAAGEGIDHLFYFGSNRITPDKIRVVENSAEEAFGQEVLNKHFLDNICTDLRIK